MPLQHSASKKAFKANAKTLLGEVGKSPHVASRAQALAIAFETQRRSRATGGQVPGFDIGGMVNPLAAPSMNNLAQQAGVPNGAPGMPMPSSNQQGGTLNGPTGVAGPSPLPMPPPTMNNAPTASPPTGTPAVGVAQNAPPAGVAPAPDNPMMRPMMASGGTIERASGGFSMQSGPHLSPSWETKQEARGMMKTGPIFSAVPGRTDNHAMRVPSGSYILPAQHLASMGQGNSMAGLSIAHSMFGGGGGPYGTPGMKIAHGSGAPRPVAPRPIKFMDGGSYSEGGARGEGDDKPVDVMLSGSEYIIPPWEVRRVGKGSLANGHKILDNWVMSTRRREIEIQKKLPPPAKK